MEKILLLTRPACSNLIASRAPSQTETNLSPARCWPRPPSKMLLTGIVFFPLEFLDSSVWDSENLEEIKNSKKQPTKKS